MNPKVLIVDDDANFREIWKIKLVNNGFDVLVASNGKEALEILKNNKPDIILLDIIMPVMDGIEMLLNIKDDLKDKNSKVFIITSLDEADPEVKNYHNKVIQELGAVKCLRKSTDLNDLVDILKKQVNLKNN